MPPRYFVARPGAVSDGSLPAPVSHLLDAFVLESRTRAPVEWVVGFDDLGRLSAQPATEVAATSRVRAQLAFHEVSGGGRRTLHAEALWLFGIELCEQTPDHPGIDDPIHLYGSLVGPLLPGLATPIEGQLTVTRADLLEATVGCAPQAFRYDQASGGRAYHLLLPGDRAEELRDGRGIVLAYPVLSADLHGTSPGNEFFFNQILYDVIAGLWTDVATEAPPPRRRAEDVPVPNRAIVAQRFVSEGYTIEGDFAVRARKGLLGQVVNAFVQDRRPLPREGTSDDYVALAKEALAMVKDWPAPRASALRACASGSVAAPRSGFAVSYPPPPPPPPRSASAHETPAWMEDFVAAHTRPGAKSPVVTRAARPPRTPVPPQPVPGPPGWMTDFAPTKAAPTDADTKSEADTAKRPDWMKDFES